MADITQLIIEETNIDEEAARLADSICTGNEKKSWLHKATATIRPNGVGVQFQVKLRNQHAWFARNPISGRRVRVGTAYSNTSTVKFTGYMGRSCEIQAYTVTSANEIYAVLGVFASLLASNGPLNLLLVEKVCSMIGGRNDALTNISFDASDELTGEDDYNYDTSTCLAKFQDPEVPVIECDIPITLTPAGKQRIKNMTFGVFVDAYCDISINVKRAEIPLWIQEDHIRIPQQTIECDLVTTDETIRIDFTVSPQVMIENRRAVNASLNMDDVSGIPSYLGERLANEVNNNEQINRTMINFVNDSGILS